MEMPVEVLERLIIRAKRIADPEVNLEQLRRESPSLRKQWWEEIEANRAEYLSLPYERNRFLESTMALAKLKLVTAAVENGESPPPGHGFRPEEIELLKEFEQFLVYDRLSVEDIKEYVRSGREDEKGIVKLARLAAVHGYDQVYKIMEQRNIPGDLAFAFQRIYQDRIKKMEVAASEIKLTEVFRDVTAAKETVVAEKPISAQEARMAEQSYIAQVEAKLKERGKGLDWKKVQRTDNLSKIHSSLKNIKPVSLEHIRESLPLGLELRAVVEKGFFIFKKPVLLLELKVLSNFRELFLSGADSGKASFGQLMLEVEGAQAKPKGYPHILALASPTGWDDRSVEYAREGRSLVGNLAVVLIDLRKGELHYNAADPRLERVLPYLRIR